MALVFDVSANLAMFRKPYTTTSMVSFPFPPPTAVAGLIGAVVGLQHGADMDAKSAAFWNRMEGLQVAVGLRKPVGWMITAVNMMKFKTANADMREHIQVKHQFVKEPCYRIYVRGTGEVFSGLRTALEKKEFRFTPCLGVAYALADINFVGEFEEKKTGSTELSLDTVVPLYEGVQPDVIETGGLHKEIVPFRMRCDRRLEEAVAVLYPEYTSERERRKIVLRERGDVYTSMVGTDRVAWFHEW